MARKRVCAKHGCPTIYDVAAGSYCPAHLAEAEAIRGSARQRGYDTNHAALRARLLPLAIGTRCPRCDQPMLRGQRLQLGHSTDRAIDPTARGDRIEHAACNEGAGGRAGADYRA